jgi:prepilin-type processing-associated H-X9-DG protein
MGQVWSKASFDGTDTSPHLGGRGSVLAVTAQNPGPDGRYGTGDDVLAPLNSAPVSVSIDAAPEANCEDSRDRVRGFYSYHPAGANFVFGDASVRFLSDDISSSAYRALSTIAGSESVDAEL